MFLQNWLKISLQQQHVTWYLIQFQLQHLIPPTVAVQTVLLSSWSRSSTFHHGAKDKDQIWKLIFKDLNKFDVFLYVFHSLFTKLENPQHLWHAYTPSTKTWASAVSNKSSKCQCSQAPKRLVSASITLRKLSSSVCFFVFVSPTNIETMYNLKMMMSPSSTSQKKEGDPMSFFWFHIHFGGVTYFIRRWFSMNKYQSKWESSPNSHQNKKMKPPLGIHL